MSMSDHDARGARYEPDDLGFGAWVAVCAAVLLSWPSLAFAYVLPGVYADECRADGTGSCGATVVAMVLVGVPTVFVLLLESFWAVRTGSRHGAAGAPVAGRQWAVVLVGVVAAPWVLGVYLVAYAVGMGRVTPERQFLASQGPRAHADWQAAVQIAADLDRGVAPRPVQPPGVFTDRPVYLDTSCLQASFRFGAGPGGRPATGAGWFAPRTPLFALSSRIAAQVLGASVRVRVSDLPAPRAVSWRVTRVVMTDVATWFAVDGAWRRVDHGSLAAYRVQGMTAELVPAPPAAGVPVGPPPSAITLTGTAVWSHAMLLSVFRFGVAGWRAAPWAVPLLAQGAGGRALPGPGTSSGGPR